MSEIEQVRELCERFGYGRVMQIAADEWARKDPMGALTVGDTCSGVSGLHEALTEVIAFIKYNMPPAPGHVCGADSNCDMVCVEYAAAAQLLWRLHRELPA